MRKRPSRPQRFVALDNASVDTLRSMTAKGLLATLIRAKDGDEVTVEALCKTHTEGREVLTKAMRALVDGAFVVKFKIQRRTTETVTLDDGSTEDRRGGSWWTTFTVDSVAFTAADVTAMLEDIFDAGSGNVKAVRVEPTHLDRRERASDLPGPTTGNPSVGPTCGNSPLDEGEEKQGDQDSSPTDGFPTVGQPTVGQPTVGQPTVGPSAAHIRKKTSLPGDEEEKDDAPSARSAVDVRRTSSTGSSACEREGGSAASSKDHPSSEQQNGQAQAKTGISKARHTRQQLDVVRAVRALFPTDLLAAPLPDVPVLSQAILDALAGDVPAADRTVEQLGKRIEQRWNHHGWAEKFYRGQVDSLVGAAVAMVRPLKPTDRDGCGNPRCEAGKDVDTGVDCHVCPERLAARKAARRTQQAASSPQTAAQGVRLPFRECPCRNPIPKDSTDHLCRDCRKQADYDASMAMASVPRQGAPFEETSAGPAPF